VAPLVPARRAGVCETPLTGDGVVAFNAPESLRATVTVPHPPLSVLYTPSHFHPRKRIKVK